MGTRGAILVTLLTAACGFEGTGATGGPQVDASTITADAPPDAPPPPVLCGDLVCDPHAVCSATQPVMCECGPGFSGDGMSCHDDDECASESPCENGATCQNTQGGYACFILDSCEEAKLQGLPDGDTTLYVGEDLEKPWTAYCVDGVTYLGLLQISENQNFAQFTTSTTILGQRDVRTKYTKLRINPATLVVDIEDRKFATSTGKIFLFATEVRSVAYGVAMDCSDNNTANGVANIDLSGVPFKVTSTFDKRGSKAAGTAVLSNDDHVVALTGGGDCGWFGPTPVPNYPVNNFTDNSSVLKLAYDADSLE